MCETLRKVALPDEPFETTELYSLISRASRVSLRIAWRVVGAMSVRQLQARSATDNSTFLHHAINQAPEVFAKYNDVNALVPLIYRLALHGVNVCAQNSHGNTCLHLACIRPHAEKLCSHLIRIGVDPCIQNNTKCRVIHTYRNHVCHLVKGQSSAPSGIWDAVLREDMDALERLLRTWCRVNITRDKTSLRQLADETSNMPLVNMIDRYEATSELVTAAFACEAERVRTILRRSRNLAKSRARKAEVSGMSSSGTGQNFPTCVRPPSNVKSKQPVVQRSTGEADLDQADESCDPPKPLIVALSEIGLSTQGIVAILREFGAKGDLEEYNNMLADRRKSFGTSEFYNCIEEGSTESLEKSLQLISSGAVDINQRGSRPRDDTEDTEAEETGETDEQPKRDEDWTYLHLVVDRYLRMQSEGLEERSRLLIRAIYRLAVCGIDVNARDSGGRTPLILAASWKSDHRVKDGANDIDVDQKLCKHLLRIGCDAMLTDPHGRTVSEEVYKDRGKLVFGRHYRLTELPGLWAAVKNNCPLRVAKCLRTWSRVRLIRDDRTLSGIARALNDDPKILRLLETYEHVNEFVCATFACDMNKMRNALAFGGGNRKVNTLDDFFHVGFNESSNSEFIKRPIIISALELCSPVVIDYLLSFGANLASQYDESYPCGPTAFWAMRDHVSNDNALVVARYADVTLRNELGMTLLHAIVAKRRTDALKLEIIATLLSRSIDVGARDFEGSTARDYLLIFNVEHGAEIRKLIDNHVLDMVSNDQLYPLETLLIESYEHIANIRGTKRNKSALEIAELKQHVLIIRFLIDHDKYKTEVENLIHAFREGDLPHVSRNTAEKRNAWIRDKGGRTLLHIAVLFHHPTIIRFLLEHYPHLINTRDNLNRTPMHYCVCLPKSFRQYVFPALQEAGADFRLTDVNNMSVLDYIRELESPTPLKLRPRGRRQRHYKPSELCDHERLVVYGLKANTYELHTKIVNMLANSESISHGFRNYVQTTTKQCDLTIADLDIDLLKKCVEIKRQDDVIFLITVLGCRPHLDVHVHSQVIDDEKFVAAVQNFSEVAKANELPKLAFFLRTTYTRTRDSDKDSPAILSEGDATDVL